MNAENAQVPEEQPDEIQQLKQFLDKYGKQIVIVVAVRAKLGDGSFVRRYRVAARPPASSHYGRSSGNNDPKYDLAARP